MAGTLPKAFYVEASQPKRAQNSQVGTSWLPAELLSSVFLYIVKSGLPRTGHAYFDPGTFNFLQVCRRWNSVAIAFPRLWVWWVAGAAEAWPLFNARSKGAPLSLMWRRELPESARDILTDTGVLRRICQLDFYDTRARLEHLVGSTNSTSTSAISSIRIIIIDWGKNEKQLTRFLSSPFPKLSKLHIRNILPDSSSSIFTTSNLTSLKISLPYNGERRHTRSQLSQLLQQHPNLEKLVLEEGGLPPVEGPGTLVPVILPRLVDLRLYGLEAVVVGFLDLVSMSSPLHSVIIRLKFAYAPRPQALVGTAEKILSPYYECQGLEYPRGVERLTVSTSLKGGLEFCAGSRSTPVPYPISNLNLQFCSHGMEKELIRRVVPLFPLKDVLEFTAVGLSFSTDDWRWIFRDMENLLHLRLDQVYLWSVFEVLRFATKPQSLSFHNLDICSGLALKLLDILERRFNSHNGLESLVVESCRVPGGAYEAGLRELVKDVTWSNVTEVGSEPYELPVAVGQFQRHRRASPWLYE